MAAAIAGEQVQQIEFVRGQLDFAIADPRVTSRWINGQPASHDRRGVPWRPRRPAPQQGPDARDELANAEELRERIEAATKGLTEATAK